MTSVSTVHSRSERIKADLILLLVSVIWGSAFVAQRVVAQQNSVFLFNGFRFWIGALVLLPLAWRSEALRQKVRHKELAWISLAGVLLFSGAAFQQLGLQYTTAANAGFITGLYVVFIPLFLAFGLKQSLRPSIWTASILATLGLFLLSTGGRLALNPGDGLELLGAGMWTFHVILVGTLVRRMDVLRLAIGQYLVCGLVSVLVGLFLEGHSLAGLADSWWAVLYTGVFSVGLGYTLQAVGQKVAPPADAAILLSLEAVFAALFGWLILSEALAPTQVLGCGFMLSGMILAQANAFDKVPP